MWDAWQGSIFGSTIKQDFFSQRLFPCLWENVHELAFPKVAKFESVAFCDPGPRPKTITLQFVFKSFLPVVEVAKVSRSN